MANESISLFKFALKFGLIGAAVSIVLTLLFFLLDMPESTLSQYASYPVLLGIILWGQIAYRKAETLVIGYGETFGLGVMIICYYALVTTVYLIVHWSFIDLELASRVTAVAEETLRSQGLPEDQLGPAIEMQKMLIGPIATPVMGFIGTMFIGTILSLITSIFTRRAKVATAS